MIEEESSVIIRFIVMNYLIFLLVYIHLQYSFFNYRAGTREVHNKLEKNRRAHLKECFEQLKKQLPQMQDEKKTSNLSILGNACRHVQVSVYKQKIN